MLSQYPQSAFQGFCGDHQKGSAAVCDPNPPRPFARSRSTTARLLIARLRGRTATQRSKKGSEKVLGRVLEKGSQKGSEKCSFHGFYTVEKGSEKGSQKGF